VTADCLVFVTALLILVQLGLAVAAPAIDKTRPRFYHFRSAWALPLPVTVCAISYFLRWTECVTDSTKTAETQCCWS